MNLNFSTINDTFFVILKNSKGIDFIVLTIYSPRIIETRYSRFIEKLWKSWAMKRDYPEVRVEISLPITSKIVVLITIVEQSNNCKQQINDKPLHNETIINEPNVDQTQGIVLRRYNWN